MKSDLSAVLAELRQHGSFLTQKLEESLVNPGRFIPNIGSVGLSLSTSQAESIIQSFPMNSPGQEEEIDSIAKTCQLNADQFSLQNPSWHSQIERITIEAIRNLHIITEAAEANVKVELYKLHIYQEGAFYLSRKDVGPPDISTVTLTINLPSKHEGGRLVVTHKDQSLTFDSSLNSTFGFSWAAWTTNVLHEMQPVALGFRIMLVYNLICSLSPMAPQPHYDPLRRLCCVFTTWCTAVDRLFPSSETWTSFTQHDCPSALVILLEHHYSLVELQATLLKGFDASLFVLLKEACRKNRFGVYLVNIEESIFDRDTHSLGDVQHARLKFSQVISTQGTVVGNDIPLPPGVSVQDNRFYQVPTEDCGVHPTDEFEVQERVSQAHISRQTVSH